MQRGQNNGTVYSLLSLPEWVTSRIMGRMDSGWTGKIELDVKDGKIIQIGYTERERAPRSDH